MSVVESYKCDDCGVIKESSDPEMYLIEGDIWKGNVKENGFMTAIISGKSPAHYCNNCLAERLGIKMKATRGILA